MHLSLDPSAIGLYQGWQAILHKGAGNATDKEVNIRRPFGKGGSVPEKQSVLSGRKVGKSQTIFVARTVMSGSFNFCCWVWNESSF